MVLYVDELNGDKYRGGMKMILTWVYLFPLTDDDVLVINS